MGVPLCVIVLGVGVLWRVRVVYSILCDTAVGTNTYDA